MKQSLDCLRCGRTMEFLMRENIQLGKTGWILGDLGNLMAGALDVTVLRCPGCGRLEFYQGDRMDGREDALPQVTCPACGVRYDFDYPKCPACGAANPKF